MELLHQLRTSVPYLNFNKFLLVVFSGGFLKFGGQAGFPAWLAPSMRIDQQDLVTMMVEWDAKKMEGSRGLHQLAVMSVGSPLDKEAVIPKDETTGLCNFKSFSPKDAIQFQPSYGSHWFKHQGIWFYFSRNRMDSAIESSHNVSGMETVTITCMGWWNQKPLQELTLHASNLYNAKHQEVTRIFRPPLTLTRQKGNLSWVLMSVRPSRKMDTIDLDPSEKDKVLRDADAYLRPSRRIWYSQRGIPYTRSYILEGPPGTGKTSLVHAIAGEFGMDIYTVSLNPGDITEEELVLLLSTTRPPCVVLFEDVDKAGLSQRHLAGGKTTHRITERIEGSISLSGLLNAIDGVNTPEGRLMIITTNYYDLLDEALRRPGRMDIRVHFDLASRDDMKSLFIRIYQPTEPLTERIIPGVRTTELNAKSVMAFTDEFAMKVPEFELAHAEIQEYLIQRRHSPAEAVRGLEEWLNTRVGRDKKQKKQPSRTRSTGEGTPSTHTPRDGRKLGRKRARSQNDGPRKSQRLCRKPAEMEA